VARAAIAGDARGEERGNLLSRLHPFPGGGGLVGKWRGGLVVPRVVEVIVAVFLAHASAETLGAFGSTVAWFFLGKFKLKWWRRNGQSRKGETAQTDPTAAGNRQRAVAQVRNGERELGWAGNDRGSSDGKNKCNSLQK
jgi:hypothetical protein